MANTITITAAATVGIKMAKSIAIVDGNSNRAYSFPIDSQVYTIEGGDVLLTPEELSKHGEVVNLSAGWEALARQRGDEMQDMHNRYTSMIDEMKNDVALINAELLDAAITNDFCEVYDEKVESLNSRLKYFHLEERVKEWTVDFEITSTVTWTYTITVEASSETEARSIAHDRIEDESLEAEINTHDFTDVVTDSYAIIECEAE